MAAGVVGYVVDRLARPRGFGNAQEYPGMIHAHTGTGRRLFP